MTDKSEYTISSSMNEDIFEIVLTGEVTADGITALRAQVLPIIQSSKTRNLLVDVRNIKGRLGIADTYERVRKYPSFFYTYRVTIVDIQENAEFGKFLEITANNAGMNLKWFTDINKARTWLKEP